MPIYEYLCEKCEHEFEREQRITDDPVKTCPSCRSRRVKRLISQTSFVLKGGGWYNDLYSSSKDGKGAKDSDSDGGSQDSASASSEGSSAKSESKDAKKSKDGKKGGRSSGSKKSGGKASKSAA